MDNLGHVDNKKTLPTCPKVAHRGPSRRFPFGADALRLPQFIKIALKPTPTPKRQTTEHHYRSRGDLSLIAPTRGDDRREPNGQMPEGHPCHVREKSPPTGDLDRAKAVVMGFSFPCARSAVKCSANWREAP